MTTNSSDATAPSKRGGYRPGAGRKRDPVYAETGADANLNLRLPSPLKRWIMAHGGSKFAVAILQRAQIEEPQKVSK